MAIASVSAHFTIGQPVNPLMAPRNFSGGPSLADDCAFYTARDGWFCAAMDSDYEGVTWCDEIDQTRLHSFDFSRFGNDDMELDDGV